MPPFKSKSGDADFDRVFNGEEGMRQQLLDELMQISEEESKYKAGLIHPYAEFHQRKN